MPSPDQPLDSPATAGPSFWRTDLPALIVFGILIFAIIRTGQVPKPTYSIEAVHRTQVAHDLLDGQSRGRQGLVGSLTLAPLPTVVISLFTLIPYAKLTALSGQILAGVATLLLGLYVNRIWAREGVWMPVRYLAVIVLLLLPPVAMSIQYGQTTMLFVALVVTGWGFLAHWLKGFALRDLAYAALFLSLSIAVRYQAILLVLGATLLVVLAALLERRNWRMLEGTALTFIVPTVYIIALWIGGNWLILGDPIFFLRGMARSIGLGIANFGTVLTAQCEWMTLGAVGVLVLMVPLASLLTPGRGQREAMHIFALLGIGAAVSLTLWTDSSSAFAARDPRIKQAVNALIQRYPNGSFIVVGYQGYDFVEAAGPDPQHRWIHVMHLEPTRLEKVLRDFRGRDVYVLVDVEETLDRWEALNLEWRGPGSRVPEHFIYVDTIGPWVMFECIPPGNT